MRAALRRWLLKGLVRLGRDPRGGGIAALTYHSLDESGSPISFPPAFCRAQLDWLAQQRYQSLTASQATAALTGRQPLPERAVAITFDDGFRSVLEVAFPLLSERGFVATVFCAAGYMGRTYGWAGVSGIPPFELMDWEEARFLADSGWEIGAHTINHARLTELPEQTRLEEIRGGRRILLERVGGEIGAFSYPYGAFDARCAEAAAECGFTSAWTMEPMINALGCNRLTLGRFNCDRVRSDSPETAALAAQICLGGQYGRYAAITARRLRVRGREGRP